MNASAVKVKLFAALRDAAGVGEVEVELPTTPAGIIDELSSRFGEKFAARVGIAAVMIDGEPVERDSDRAVHPGAEVALLPPFAGG